MTRNQAVLRAFGGKLNLGALCVAVGSAAALQSWLVLLTGMAMFAGLIFADVRSDRRRLQLSPAKIPDGSAFKNGIIRAAVEAIGAAQKERLEVLDTCPDDILGMLDGILRAAAEVEAAALRIARRAERLHGYLCTKDVAFVRSTLRTAQEAAEHARTPCEQQSYEAAARTYEVEVATLEGIERGMRATLAKLEHIRATLTAVPPRIMKLLATSADMEDASYLRLSEDLHRESGELDEVEQHLHALSRGGGGELGIECRRIASGNGDLRILRVAPEPGGEPVELDEPPSVEQRRSHHLRD
jgi:hypothetical protein